MRFNPPYCFASLCDISFSVVFTWCFCYNCDSSEDYNKLYNDYCKLLSKNGSGANKSQILLETLIQILILDIQSLLLFKLEKVAGKIPFCSNLQNILQFIEFSTNLCKF